MIYALVGDNGVLYHKTDVIDTYVFRTLRTTGNPSQAMAISLFQAIMGFICVWGSNYICLLYTSHVRIRLQFLFRFPRTFRQDPYHPLIASLHMIRQNLDITGRSLYPVDVYKRQILACLRMTPSIIACSFVSSHAYLT